MSNDFELQGISELIERALSILDNDNHINDEQAKGILECLLDKYHFKEESVSFNDPIEEQGFLFINEHLETNYHQLSQSLLSKVICTVMRSIRRHKTGSRGYMDFIHQYVDI